MSHFATAVILKDINNLEKALAPFQENNMGDCPREYLQWHSITAEYKEKYESETTSMVKMPDGRLLSLYDKEFSVEGLIGIEANKFKVPENSLIEEIPYKQLYSSFEEFMEECFGDEPDEEMKDYGYWENPNAKWDYWRLCELGSFARFQDERIAKGYCKVKDYPKDINQKEYNKALRIWEIVVEGKPILTQHEKEYLKFGLLFSKEFYLERYGTKENFATISATPHTFALLYNGQWYEKGAMYWFGISDAEMKSEKAYLEKFQQIINDPANQELYIAIVDCHI